MARNVLALTADLIAKGYSPRLAAEVAAILVREDITFEVKRALIAPLDPLGRW